MTECFADLFNRADLDSKSMLVRRLFIPANYRDRWDAYCIELKSLHVETQYPLINGRIDLLLVADGNPIIVIENKIASPISVREDNTDQLALYGRWIRSKSKGSFPPTICLLSHTTQPDRDFLVNTKRSGGAIPHVVKWSDVGSALTHLRDAERTSGEVRSLASELFMFLGEKDMSHEFAGRDEFAAALVYLRAGSRMDHTFDTIYKRLKTIGGHFPSSESIHELSLHFETKNNLIWGWKYLAHPTLNGLFFGYGIALQPNETFKSAGVPTRDSVFLCVGADDRKSMQALRAAKDIPERPWIYAELQESYSVINFKPLHSFMAEPRTFAAQMIEWIDDVASSVNGFIAGLK